MFLIENLFQDIIYYVSYLYRQFLTRCLSSYSSSLKINRFDDVYILIHFSVGKICRAAYSFKVSLELGLDEPVCDYLFEIYHILKNIFFILRTSI